MNNKYDISLILPSIRTHNLPVFYAFAEDACTRYDFEIVIVSPFNLPEHLKYIPNIKYIKDYGCPSRATQIAVAQARGEYIYNCVDDGIFFPNCIDTAIDYFKANLKDKDVLNMRYRELEGGKGHQIPMSFWSAHFHQDLAKLAGVKSWYKISLHFLMRREYYKSLGGIDCTFEYVNHGAHDLMFRIQEDGGTLYDSPIEGLTCDHMPNRTGDHGPIHDAQINHDEGIFVWFYSDEGAAKGRIVKDYDDWKDCPAVWDRRFGKFGDNLPTSYEQLLK